MFKFDLNDSLKFIAKWVFFFKLYYQTKNLESHSLQNYTYTTYILRGKRCTQKNGENNTDIFKGLTQIFALGLDIHWTRPDCILSKIWV
jgi:hypothetical protein